MPKRKSTLASGPSTSVKRTSIETAVSAAINKEESSESEASQAMAKRLIAQLQKKYAKAACPKRAASAKAYLRNQFELYGIQNSDRKILDEDVLCDFEKEFSVDDLLSILPLLWAQQHREFQYFGLDLCKRYKEKLAAEDDITRCVEAIKHCIVTKSWWDTVDMLASHPVGMMVRRRKQIMVPVMDQWINDDNMWVRRTAILHQLHDQRDTDQKRLFRYCELRLHEREFFIEKSIGWALRTYHRSNEQAVEDFVRRNKSKMAKLSVREALKHSKNKDEIMKQENTT